MTLPFCRSLSALNNHRPLNHLTNKHLTLYFLAELTPYHVEARYGDYKEKLAEIIGEKKVEEVYINPNIA